MQFNVAIRTMVAKDGLIHISVGGGIVADSEPAAEYDETLVKARAMFAALGDLGRKCWSRWKAGRANEQRAG